MSGFRQFNERYVETLREWGLFRDGLNPVARSNVAPDIAPPAEPSFYAFCYTLRAQTAAGFVVAGSGEWPEHGTFPDDIVARGDVSRCRRAGKGALRHGHDDAAPERARCILACGDGGAGVYGARYSRRRA